MKDKLLIRLSRLNLYFFHVVSLSSEKVFNPCHIDIL